MSYPLAKDFRSFIDGLAIELAGHSPTFEAFVAALPGVLPDEALAALQRIGDSSARRLIADAARDRAGALVDQCALLPLPHPLDSEFRFDAASASILAASLIENTKDGDEILLIGVPSVAVELAAYNAARVIRFLGPDNCVTDAVRAAFQGQRIELEQGSGGTAAAALLDPPWYPQPMDELIGVCASGLRRGALVTLVMPPIGTRPEIALDRSSFFAAANRHGLEQTGTEGPVCYRTPLFELAAMERQGIARLTNWRRGEAVEFVMNADAPFKAWVRPRPLEFSVRGIRLRLTNGGTRGSASLTPIGGHEVFPSVSTRAPGRARASLWTTTNRAFEVESRAAQHALSELSRRPELWHLRFTPAENGLETNQYVDTSTKLIHQLVELVGREIDDARRLVGDGAWLETVMDWRY